MMRGRPGYRARARREAEESDERETTSYRGRARARRVRRGKGKPGCRLYTSTTPQSDSAPQITTHKSAHAHTPVYSEAYVLVSQVAWYISKGPTNPKEI